MWGKGLGCSFFAWVGEAPAFHRELQGDHQCTVCCSLVSLSAIQSWNFHIVINLLLQLKSDQSPWSGWLFSCMASDCLLDSPSVGASYCGLDWSWGRWHLWWLIDWLVDFSPEPSAIHCIFRVNQSNFVCCCLYFVGMNKLACHLNLEVRPLGSKCYAHWRACPTAFGTKTKIWCWISWCHQLHGVLVLHEWCHIAFVFCL